MSDLKHWLMMSLPFTQMVRHDAERRADDDQYESEKRQSRRPPPTTQVQLDLRHILATVVSAAIVGLVVMYGQSQTIKPRLDALEKKLEACHGHIEMLRRDLYAPRWQDLPQSYRSWLKQEWWI